MQQSHDRDADLEDWLKVQEPAFWKAWENDEDGIYDSFELRDMAAKEGRLD
jgi:hypothetical protein